MSELKRITACVRRGGWNDTIWQAAEDFLGMQVQAALPPPAASRMRDAAARGRAGHAA
jgi:hypothetical protein